MGASTEAARSGMLFQQQNIEAIAHNIANLNTAGYKRLAVHFEDILTRAIDLFDPAESTTNVADSAGTYVTAIAREMSQGELVPSGAMTDMGIAGEGFFRVLLPDGTAAYTRDGSFRPDGEGRLVTPTGFLLDPEIRVPAGTTSLHVSADGTVTAFVGDEGQEIGRLELALFVNPPGLNWIGGNLYLPSENSGEAQAGEPGSGGRGIVAAGVLERSNVDAGEEMTALLMAQRAYQMSLSAYQAASEMSRLASEIPA